MKMFVVLALAAMAMAEPEADPQVLLNTGLHGVTSINNVPVVNTLNTVHTPVVNSVVRTAPVVTSLSGLVTSYSGLHTPVVRGVVPSAWGLGKREAEAEPEADPALVYSTAGVLPAWNGVRAWGVGPSVYGNWGVRTVVPTVTTRWGLGKREAEAEPEAEADPALVYTNGLVHSGVVGTALPYTSTWGAWGVPSVRTVVPSVWGLGKREAEAEPEADPALLYTNGLVHSGVVGSPLISALTPAVRTVHTPVVSTVHTAPVVTKSVLNTVVPSVRTIVPAVTPVAKTVNHGVVNTYAGLVHSSHAGICLNNQGVQVPC